MEIFIHMNTLGDNLEVFEHEYSKTAFEYTCSPIQKVVNPSQEQMDTIVSTGCGVPCMSLAATVVSGQWPLASD